MRIEDGRCLCTWCGAVTDIPPGKPYRTEIQAAGGKENERVVIIGSEEVHRCKGAPKNRTGTAFAPLGAVWPRSSPVA